MTNGQGGSATLVPTPDMVDEGKRNLRRKARRTRENLQAETGSVAAAELANRFLATIPCDLSAVVAGYWPMGSEIDVRPLCRRLRDAGVSTALPVVSNKSQPLIFRVWEKATELAPGPYGTHQPTEASRTVAPDILLVPLLAFDARGNRLGYGGGYYDRTLTALRALRSVLAIGVAFDGQRVDRLEVGVHDAPLDGVVTERDAYYPIPH